VTYESRMGKRPRLVLVHGSVANAETTWSAQKPLAERFELVVPGRRGFPPQPEVERVDFEDEAAWLEPFIEPGTHLVGHSYGAVIALVAATLRREQLRSLTVIEPPAFGLARGDPAADAAYEGGERLWREGPRDPEAFLRAFLDWVGTPLPPGRFSPELLQGARILQRERPPWTVDPALERLEGLPILAVSGAHAPAFEAVCDVLAGRLRAERAVLPGAGHSVQRLGPPFNALLAAFVERVEQNASPAR
jgi:pimeloyl-ACP methyl ester carboxylesterase